jgi:hypothetical protein
VLQLLCMCLTCQESEDAKLPIKLLLQLLEAANTILYLAC